MLPLLAAFREDVEVAQLQAAAGILRSSILAIRHFRISDKMAIPL
jgi:hypothetical protein